MAYIPEVDSGRIEDGTVEFVDLSPALQAMISGSLPVGASISYPGTDLPSMWLWEDGDEHSRATYSDLLDALTTTRSGTLTIGTPNVTGIASTKGIKVGAAVEGAGIPAGTTVAAVPSATAITLSQNATLSGAQDLTYFNHGNGDGSTTFNAPDSRGLVDVAPDDMGNNGSAGILGASEFGIGHKFGVREVALTPTQAPLRAHSHSGTTGNDNIDHGHSGSTGGITANHTHSGTTGTVSSDHAHYPSNFQGFVTGPINQTNLTTGGALNRWLGQSFAPNGATSGFTANHVHGFGTGFVSSDHGHNFSTGGRSAFHQHAFTTGNPSVAEANGDAHANMQPSRIANKIIYAGA